MEVSVYHLSFSPLEKVLPKLLEKALAGEKRVVVRTKTQEYCTHLNALLWTYTPKSFLPHGVEEDGHQAQQPIWLTCLDENPNGATLLVLTEGANIPETKGFDRILDLTSSTDTTLQDRLNRYKESSSDLTQWSQDDKGLWQKVTEGS
ncbi:MAG: DNA polymerase III subunit chi [bacterium]|nr:DNA polymerase III subunit chi [bacterium]